MTHIATMNIPGTLGQVTIGHPSQRQQAINEWAAVNSPLLKVRS